MAREVPMEEGSCGSCDFKGMVFDFMGDTLCPRCANKAIGDDDEEGDDGGVSKEAHTHWMRQNPLTQKLMNDGASSAHAFWEMQLTSPCHPMVGLKVVYKAPGGVVEMTCSVCGDLCGVFLVAEGTKEKA